MSLGTSRENRRIGPTHWRVSLGLAVVTVFALVPFLFKPFHIDDPLFIWAAKHIQQEPGNFYNFQVNWTDRFRPMHEITQNPPLACYYWAAAAALGGGNFNEWWLHTAGLLPAIGVVLGTARLARGLCRRPSLAAVGVLCTPIFLISSTNVMCDTLMSCWWVWSVVCWREGLEEQRTGKIALAAGLASLAALTKYFGIALLPLLLMDGLVRSFPRFRNRTSAETGAEKTGDRVRSSPAMFAWLLLPIAVMVGFEVFTRHLYGHGLLSGAADYAKEYYLGPKETYAMKAIATLTFSGCSLISLLFYAYRTGLRYWHGVLILMGAGVLAWVLLDRSPHFIMPNGRRPTTIDLCLQVTVQLFLGAGVIALTLGDFWTTVRNYRQAAPETGRIGLAGSRVPRGSAFADSLLLLCWVAGTIFFTGCVNWTINGRSVLPMVPALSILLCRRLDFAAPQAKPRWLDWWPVLPAAAITLIATQTDYVAASAAREAAQRVMGIAAAQQRHVWFSGHWGFQYYMEQLGAEGVHGGKIDVPNSASFLRAGGLFVLPMNNDVWILPPPNVGVLDVMKLELSPWGTSQVPARCTGFYSSLAGVMPFGLGQEYQTDPKYYESAKDTRYDSYRLLELLEDAQIERQVDPSDFPASFRDSTKSR